MLLSVVCDRMLISQHVTRQQDRVARDQADWIAAAAAAADDDDENSNNGEEEEERKEETNRHEQNT